MDWKERLKQLTGSNKEDDSSLWHAVFVMTGNEETVREKIAYTFKDADILPVVPKRRINERKNGVWHEKIKPLFPGYILLKGNITIDDYYNLKTVPGILRILKDNNELYRIHPDEIKIIGRLMIDGETIGVSTAYQQGDSIVITDGPLLGMEGLIQSVDNRKGRVRVCLSFLGDKRTVDLSIKLINKPVK
ncbi:MAG: antiterminator LoaP [Acetivibrionales bacterium]|jgi:transcriptional antiterminator NusG